MAVRNEQSGRSSRTLNTAGAGMQAELWNQVHAQRILQRSQALRVAFGGDASAVTTAKIRVMYPLLCSTHRMQQGMAQKY